MTEFASPSSDMAVLLKSTRVRWLAYFAGWTLFALFFLSEDVSRLYYQGRPVVWRDYLVVWLTTAYAWAILAPLVWHLSRRVPINRRSWRRAFGVHLIFSAIIALGEETIFALVTPLFGLPWFKRNFVATLTAVLPIDFHLNLIVYWLIVGGQHGMNYYRKYCKRELLSASLELRAAELQKQLAEARLNALRMQLEPHFLFNTLNAITVLVRKQNTRDADEMLTNLSEILRETLAGSDEQEVPLREEIEFLKLYLDIERVRFPDRLQVIMKLELATLDALVPSFLLQPLVENAIRHGIAKRSSAGRVELKSRLTDSMLEIQVCDDGPGISQAVESKGHGLGLSNTRARLRELYREQQSLCIENAHAGGTVTTVMLPFHLPTDAQRRRQS